MESSSGKFRAPHFSRAALGLRALRGELINDDTGEVFELEEVSSIGRSRDSVVVVPDPRVSRRHALIRSQQDGFWFFDLGSVNGSYVNERRVTTSVLLRDGDLIRIGTHRYRFAGSAAKFSNETETMTATDVTLVEVRSREAILLVCDIQGFTSLSEKLSPDLLAPIIGSWYAATEAILDEHGATLDKFQGDCVLAYWLETSPAARRQALHAALAMQRACDEVEAKHETVLAEVASTFRSGSALHLGPIAYGAFSSKEFTLLGDAVNLVFRLENLTRSLGERVLLSADLLNGWPDPPACRSLGSHRLKGRTQAVKVYAVDPSGK